MTYRSAEGALRERLDEVGRELFEVEAREKALSAECEASEAAVAELTQRLAVSGPGGAARGPSFDRIGVLIAGLCVVGVLVIPAELHIARYLKRQPEETVIPILLLGGPGVLSFVVAWPYRNEKLYRLGVVIGALLVLVAVATVMIGYWA